MTDLDSMSNVQAQLSTTICRLHEGLFAKSLLQHYNAADITPGPVDLSIKPPTTTWHRFLDALCQLCQFDKGANTTVSIAAEAAKDAGASVVFWLATNTGKKVDLEGIRHKRRNHLEAVLRKLEQIGKSKYGEQEMKARNASEVIFNKSAKQSEGMIANYQQRLRLFVSKVADELKLGSKADKSLLKRLERLTLEKDRTELCRLAHNFRTPNSAELEVLKSKINRSSQEVWKEIRHFIGRLGALKQAADFVASHAVWLSSELRSTQVSSVVVKPTKHTLDLEINKGIHSLLCRVCPRLNDRGLLDPTAEKMRRASVLLNKLTKETNETVVHAEVAMAHHFYKNDLRFVNDIAYVGCSKPSCYGCSLYLTEHPGGFLPRQTSGNAYSKWAPPLFENEDLGIDGATRQTLASMLSRIDGDILSGAQNRNFVARRQFDSTTGHTPTGRAITIVE